MTIRILIKICDYSGFISIVLCRELPQILPTVYVIVATPPVVLRWLCDSPRTGCVWRTTPYIYVARTSNKRVIPMEWPWWVTSDNACEPGEQLIVLADGDDESDLVGWSLLLLAATVRSSAHMLLGISDRNIIISKTALIQNLIIFGRAVAKHCFACKNTSQFVIMCFVTWVKQWS